jgi:hypothetical protein
MDIRILSVLIGLQSIVLCYQIFITLKYQDSKSSHQEKRNRDKATLERLSRGGGPKK